MRNGKTKIRLYSRLLLGCLVLAALPVMADSISDTLTVFNPAGKPIYVLTAAQNASSGGQNLFFIANPYLSNMGLVGQYTVVCDIPGCNTNNDGVLVGVFRVPHGTSGEDYVGFMLPPALGSFGGTAGGYIVTMASGAPISATEYLSPTMQSAGWTATFVSAPGGLAAPEPSEFMLLGSGVIAIVGLARRRFLR